MPQDIDFNKVLKRPIKAGLENQNLFPKYENNIFHFEKNSEESDVYDTLKFMSEWATKFAHQGTKAAPMLKGESIEETVKFIYSFLYQNFQYRLDTETQILHSPASAVAYRFVGFDCKSFSVLASIFLQCLNIPHYFKMVKQPGLRSVINPNEWLINPNYWSHVYVTVPTAKGNYLVIDATTHDNKEVQFTDAYEYKIDMRHVGLYSPNIYAEKSALGCSCGGSKLGAPQINILPQAINNLHKFLDEIEKQGVPREISNRILHLVRTNLENGIDPNFEEVLGKAFSKYNGKLNGGNVVTDSISIHGNSASSILTAGTAAFAGNPTALLGIATSFLPKDLVSKTFMAVFQNGMAVNCWGSTYTPAQTRGYAKVDFPVVYEQTLGKGINAENLHLFYDTLTNVVHQMIENGTNMNSCSRDAMIGTYGKMAQDFRDATVENLKKYVKLIPIENSIIPSGATFMQHFQMNSANKARTNPLGTLRWRVEALEPTVTKNPNGTYLVTQADGSTQTYTEQQIKDKIAAANGQNPAGTNEQNGTGGTKPPTPPKSNNTLIYGGLALGSLFLIAPMFKDKQK